MTNVSWTPGPWRRGGLHISAFVIVPQGTETHPVADVYAEANARLIAEAPAMAEALEDMVEALSFVERRYGTRINPPTLDKARAILLRIRGDAS